MVPVRGKLLTARRLFGAARHRQGVEVFHGWLELKAKMEATYAPPFSVNYVWRDLANLKRSRTLFLSTRASQNSPGSLASLRIPPGTARACGMYITRR